jgi:hypothetical protein
MHPDWRRKPMEEVRKTFAGAGLTSDFWKL